jgi:hypothetical protein
MADDRGILTYGFELGQTPTEGGGRRPRGLPNRLWALEIPGVQASVGIDSIRRFASTSVSMAPVYV